MELKENQYFFEQNKLGVFLLKKYLPPLFIAFTILLFAIYFRSIFVFFLLISLDFLNCFIERNYRLVHIPIDFIIFGVIVFIYASQIKFALILPFFVIINRLPFAKVERRHFVKVAIIYSMVFITSYLVFVDLYFASVIIFIFRYLIEYIIDYVFFGSVNLKRIGIRIIHIICSIIFTYSLGPVVLYFLAS